MNLQGHPTHHQKRGSFLALLMRVAFIGFIAAVVTVILAHSLGHHP